MSAVEILRWFVGARERSLYIDQKRINVEVQRERRAECELDLGSRNKVKRRMLLGLTSAELPPLYQREERRVGPPGTLTFPKQPASR